MGRMLEALKQAETRRPLMPPPAAADSASASDEEERANVPFIEVGGPRSELIASPDVLAAAPIKSAPVPQLEPNPAKTTVEPQQTGPIQGTIALWCSWTIRPGA